MGPENRSVGQCPRGDQAWWFSSDLQWPILDFLLPILDPVPKIAPVFLRLETVLSSTCFAMLPEIAGRFPQSTTLRESHLKSVSLTAYDDGSTSIDHPAANFKSLPGVLHTIVESTWKEEYPGLTTRFPGE